MLKLAGHTHAYPQQPLEVALREIGALGFEGVDIWATPRMGKHLWPGRHDANTVRAMLDDHGLKPVVVSGFFGDRDLYKGRMELAAAIGAKTYLLNIPRDLGDFEHWTDYVEFILSTAKSYGLEVAFENHKFTPLETGDQIREFLTQYPDPALGIAFAPTHYYTCGGNPEDGIRICGDRIKIMYLWDVKKDIVQGSKSPHHEDPRTQVPGGGKLDWSSIAQAIDEVGYAGWCVMFSHGTDEWSLGEIAALYKKGIRVVHDAWDKAGVPR